MLEAVLIFFQLNAIKYELQNINLNFYKDGYYLTSGSEGPRKYQIPPFIDLTIRREVSNNSKVGV